MADTQDHILSIDWGSTHAKAAVFDTRLERLAESARPVRYAIRDAERAELDPEEVWESTADLIRAACRDAALAPRRLGTIALTSQAQTFTVLDAAGEPVLPFLSWLDRRSRDDVAPLAEALGAGFHESCSYPGPRPALQLCKIRWLQRTRAGLIGPDARVAPLTSFLALRLAGVLHVDRNLAAMTGLYSLRTGGWWPEALRLSGLREEQLPPLIDVGESVRVVKPCTELGLSPDLQILFAGNDQTAGAYGNRCHDGGLVVTLGTALVSYRHAGSVPGPYSPGGCWGPYPAGGFYELAGQDEGGAALDWARERLMPGRDIAAFLAAARSAHDSQLRNTPLFYPSRMGTDEVWLGEEDRDARALAVLEGISFALKRLILDGLRVGLPVPSVCVSGGGSRSAFWLQLLADILNSPVRRAEGDALLGAAAMARRESLRPESTPAPPLLPAPPQAAYYDDLYCAWSGTRR